MKRPNYKRASFLSAMAAIKRAGRASVAMMLHYALVFFLIAIIAALLGFTGIAAGAASIAKILFFIFLIFAIATLLGALFHR